MENDLNKIIYEVDAVAEREATVRALYRALKDWTTDAFIGTVPVGAGSKVSEGC